MAAHTCNPSIWEVNTGGLEVQVHPLQHSELEAKWGCVRPCLETNFIKMKNIKKCSLVTHLSLQIWKQLLVAPVAVGGYRLHASGPRAGHSPIPVWVVQGNRTKSLDSCLVGRGEVTWNYLWLLSFCPQITITFSWTFERSNTSVSKELNHVVYWDRGLRAQM